MENKKYSKTNFGMTVTNKEKNEEMLKLIEENKIENNISEEEKEVTKKYEKITPKIKKSKENKTELETKPEDSKEISEDEMTEEEILVVTEKLQKILYERNIDFQKIEEKVLKDKEEEEFKKKILKENSELKEKLKEKLKQEEELYKKRIKPKSVKIQGISYEKIKKYCDKRNIKVEDWLEAVAIKEIDNREYRLPENQYNAIIARYKGLK